MSAFGSKSSRESGRPTRVLASRQTVHALSRRSFLAGVLGVGAVSALAACAPGSGGGAAAPTATAGGSAGPVTREINMYTWGDYDDPEVLKEWGKVALDSFGSNEEMISKLQAANGTSGYDIVVPTHNFLPQMVQAGLLQPLDKSKLPNFANLEESAINQEFDPDNQYSVPKAWGIAGFAYDTTVIKRELTSWKDFWDAAQNEAAGKTSLLEDASEVAAAYFFSQGIDPFTTDEGQLQQYHDFILGIAGNIEAFESYPSSTISQNGRVLAQAWNGDARNGIITNNDKDRYKFVVPTDGATRFQDNWCIPVGAPNPDGAHDFINHVLDPKISLQELEYIGYPTGVKGVEEAARAADVERPDLIFYTPDQVAQFSYLKLTDALQKLNDYMNELRAAAG